MKPDLFKAATLVGACAMLAACSGTTDQDDGAAEETGDAITVSAAEEAIDLLPEDVRSAGTINIVMDATQGEPFTFFADGSDAMQGITADMASVLAQALDLEVNYSNVPFDGLITGLQAQRYDLSIAPMLMTDERLTKVDMIGFLIGGSRFLVPEGSEHTALTLDDTCGLHIGATSGSVEAAALDEQSTACVEDGREAIEIDLFPRTSEGIVALTSGRLDAYDTASAAAGYISAQNPQLTASGDPYNSGVSSMALQKDSDLSEAVEAAFQHVIDEGAYEQILAKYGVEDLAVPHSSLNEPAQ